LLPRKQRSGIINGLPERSCPIRNLAIIPIRSGSKRIANKNIRNFFGKPIFVYTLEDTRKCGLFDEIMVSTESIDVVELCVKHGLEVPFLRPEDLASDNAQLVDVCAHVIEVYEERGCFFDNFCLLWATAPMRTAEDIVNAYNMLDKKAEAVVAITDYDLPVFCAMSINEEHYLKPLFPECQKLPSIKQPRATVDNGSMCWVKVKAFKEHKTWLPPKLKGYWMPRSRSIDLDDQEAWDLLEFYYKKYFLEK